MFTTIHESLWISLALLPTALWACVFAGTRLLRSWSPPNPVHKRGYPRRPHPCWSNRRWAGSLIACLAFAIVVLIVT